MSVEEVGAIWGTIAKVDTWAARKAYRTAQNLGMRYQNWRHKGAGDSDGTALATAAGVPAASPVKPGKSWSTDEESFSNTTTSHTTYTRKRTR